MGFATEGISSGPSRFQKTNLIKSVIKPLSPDMFGISDKDENIVGLILNYYPPTKIRDWMDDVFTEYLIMPNKIRVRYGGPPIINSPIIHPTDKKSDYETRGFKLIFKNKKDMTLFLIKFGDEHT